MRKIAVIPGSLNSKNLNLSFEKRINNLEKKFQVFLRHNNLGERKNKHKFFFSFEKRKNTLFY